MDKLVGIYVITNLRNNKKYIGQSKNIKYRFCRHKSNLRGNYHYSLHLQNSWNKYGEENFEFSIIELCLEEELDDKEILYIKKYKTYNNKYGYNSTKGGNEKRIFTEELSEKFSKAQKSKPIYQIDLNGNILKLWKQGAREASRKLNINQSGIISCLKNKTKKYKNYIWIYKKDLKKFNLNSHLINKTHKSVIQYNLDYTIFKRYDSAKDVEEFGFNYKYICECCRNKKTYKGFIWEYENKNIILN